jgi:hypothetical protein
MAPEYRHGGFIGIVASDDFLKYYSSLGRRRASSLERRRASSLERMAPPHNG